MICFYSCAKEAKMKYFVWLLAVFFMLANACGDDSDNGGNGDADTDTGTGEHHQHAQGCCLTGHVRQP